MIRCARPHFSLEEVVLSSDLDSYSDHVYRIQDPANCVRSFLQMLISQLPKDRVEIRPKFRRNGEPAVVSGKPCRRTRPELRLAGV